MKNKRKTYNQYIRRNNLYRYRVPVIIAGVVVIAAVVLAAVFFVKERAREQAENEKVDYVEMTESTIPIISMTYGGEQVNFLHGYTQEMETAYMREALYILEDTYDIPLTIDNYGTQIKDVSFELTDVNGENLIQSSSVTDLAFSEDTFSCTLRIDNIIDEGEEYLLDIILTDGDDRQIHYYCLVRRDASTTLSDQLELALSFTTAIYEAADDEDALDYVTGFMETNYLYDDNTDFSSVSLYSSVNSLIWNQMDVSVAGDIEINILDVDDEYGYFRFNYIVTRTDSGTEEYIYVSEYYRIYVTGELSYIMNYERTANQFFEPSDVSIGTTSAILGIFDNDYIDMMCDLSGTFSCFTANGSLYAMNTEEKSIKCIFTFSTGAGDSRGSYDRHKIKILNVSEDGDIQFIVYGYMNAGLHEGSVGIAMYSYDAEEDLVTEEVFVPAAVSYDILDQLIGELFYLNSDNELYMIAGECLYRINIEDGSTGQITDGLEDGNYIIHTDGDYIAWQDGGENDADRIYVMDLETDEIISVEAQDGKKIKVIGFLNEDFVYGSGDEGNTYTDSDVNEYLLMTDIIVINDEGEVQESYSSDDGTYYYGAADEYNRVIIHMFEESGDSYSQGEDFTIFSTELEDYPEMELYSEYEDIKKTVYYVIFADDTTSAGELAVESDATVRFSTEDDVDLGDIFISGGRYYVYAKGYIQCITESAAEAINTAYENCGVVIDDEGEILYRRSKIPTNIELTSTVLEEALSRAASGDMLDVTGITLTEALYFVGQRMAVVWEYESDLYIFLGYDYDDNMTMQNVETGEEITLTSEYLESVFQSSGSCYVVR